MTLPGVEQLLEQNRRWAAEKLAGDSQFFQRLVAQQAPRYLWIGCSDSRVPANEIVGLPPGQMFVHRNVSNLVVPSDLNCLSVIQFAVDVLNVQHIIVCGHYGCGGVLAALRNQRLGLIDNWLQHIQDVKFHHDAEVSGLSGEVAQHRRLCELNVAEQARNVARTHIVRDAWKRGQELQVHGWIYDISDGLLNDLQISIGA